MIRRILAAIALALCLAGCGPHFDRDPLKVYQADPIDLDFPTMAVVYF